MKKYLLVTCLLTMLFHRAKPCHAQIDVLVNMGLVDGLDLSPDNFLSFQIISQLNRNTRTLVEGTIRYRNSDMRIAYRFECNLHPGVNRFDRNTLNLQMQYSSTALKELFEQYKKLPQGIYEYCVTVKYDYDISEVAPGTPIDECVYHKSEDIFLINLIDPENDAEIYEYHPVLSWMVNYPFASALKYRLRVVAVQEGQNAVAAITRNNPVFDERNLGQMSKMYPVYAKPLEKFQLYAWTVDAYYKGILLGGAEPWTFTIIEDSLFKAALNNQSYVDIKKESGSYDLYAEGVLKLNYYLDDLKADSLSLQLLDKDQKPVKLRHTSMLPAVYGDNRYIIDFYQQQPLKHQQFYTLLLSSQNGQVYKVFFQYINPELIK